MKDKNDCVPAEYLHAEDNDTDKAIQRALAIAQAELTIGVGPDSADIASDDDAQDDSEGSESD